MNHLQRTLKVSERFACRVVGQHRSTQRHTPASQTVEDPDAALRAWLREYAGKHPRWGHRRAYHDARGEGWTVNHKKIQRLWREEGLRVVVKRRRKRVGSSTVPPVPSATGPNMVWAIDFQFDSTTDGRPGGTADGCSTPFLTRSSPPRMLSTLENGAGPAAAAAALPLHHD